MTGGGVGAGSGRPGDGWVLFEPDDVQRHVEGPRVLGGKVTGYRSCDAEWGTDNGKGLRVDMREDVLPNPLCLS